MTLNRAIRHHLKASCTLSFDTSPWRICFTGDVLNLSRTGALVNFPSIDMSGQEFREFLTLSHDPVIQIEDHSAHWIPFFVPCNLVRMEQTGFGLSIGCSFEEQPVELVAALETIGEEKSNGKTVG